MKKIILTLCMTVSSAWAAETISIYSPYSPSHSGTPATQKILQVANKMQTDFKFVLEFKPGGQQLIAVKELDRNYKNSLAVIAPKYVEHIASEKISKNDYVPVFALGDACWVLISNLGNTESGISSLAGNKEVIVGGVGFGNATHLTSLQLGEKLNFNPRYITFKSNFDALVLMVGKGEINMVVERYNSYEQFKGKANINVLAASCPTRLPQAPQIKTLAEQGIEAPFVFNMFVAHKDMNIEKRQNIRVILEAATRLIGEATILQLSDMRPPLFSNISVDHYYETRLNTMFLLLNKHGDAIQNAQNNK